LKERREREEAGKALLDGEFQGYTFQRGNKAVKTKGVAVGGRAITRDASMETIGTERQGGHPVAQFLATI
jgi:hypothetical protein